MSENQKNVERDRKLRIEKDKDQNNLITQDNQKNILAGKVIDIYDIINKSSDPVVIKLRNLKKYSVTDEMIKEAYSDSASNIENESSAIDVLGNVFKRLALYVTYLPNGIVIDLKTGEPDVKASYRQALRIGILDQESIESFKESSQEKASEELIDFFSNKEAKAEAIEENEYIKELIKDIDSVYDEPKFNDLFKQDPDNFKNLSSEARNLLKSAKENLLKEDSRMIELYKIEIELDEARNTPRYDAILREKQKFLAENPDYAKEAENLRYPDGKLKQGVVYKFNEINENLKISCLLTGFAAFNDKDIDSIKPNERKGLIASAVAGLGYGGTSRESEIIRKECWKVLETFCPELKRSRNFKDILYPFLEKELALKERLTPDKFDKLIEICGESVGRSLDLKQIREMLKTDDSKIKTDGKFVEYFNNNSSILNFQKEMESFGKSGVEKYFYNSRINFDIKDGREFNSIYRDCTINSWIDNKEDALILEYATLARTKEKLNKNPSEYDKETLNKIDRTLKELKEKYPNLQEKCEENGKLKDDVNKKAEEYQNNMIESALLKFYSIDIMSENSGKGYKDLDSKHKKAYLRNIIVGLNYGKEKANPSIVKIAQRRLELLNSKDKNFISFDENGNAIVNEQEILNEYNSMAEHRWDTYEELSRASEARKDAYILKKLDEYEKLDRSDFIKLDKSKDLLEQIEDIKARSNQPKTNIKNTNEQERESSKFESNGSNEKTAIDTKEKDTGVAQKKLGFWGTIKNRIQNLFRPRLAEAANKETAIQSEQKEPMELKNTMDAYIVSGVEGKIDISQQNLEGKPSEQRNSGQIENDDMEEK